MESNFKQELNIMNRLDHQSLQIAAPTLEMMYNRRNFQNRSSSKRSVLLKPVPNGRLRILAKGDLETIVLTETIPQVTR